MKKADSAKLKKKELKSTLVTTIEKTLDIDPRRKGLKKLKKSIDNAANKIASKYLKKYKKKKDETISSSPDTSDFENTIKKTE